MRVLIICKNSTQESVGNVENAIKFSEEIIIHTSAGPRRKTFLSVSTISNVSYEEARIELELFENRVNHQLIKVICANRLMCLLLQLMLLSEKETVQCHLIIAKDRGVFLVHRIRLSEILSWDRKS